MNILYPSIYYIILVLGLIDGVLFSMYVMEKLDYEKLKIKFMTGQAALAHYFLTGKTLNIKNCFQIMGYTNLPREASRLIEHPFQVRLTKIPRDGTSRYGHAVRWFDYKLQNTPENKEGIERMKEYVREQLVAEPPPKTDKQSKTLQQSKTILKQTDQVQLF